MAPAASIPGSRAASAKLRPPPPSSSTASRSSPNPVPVPPVPVSPLELPPMLPTLAEVQPQYHIVPSAALVAERLASLAHAYISLCSSSDSQDVLSWEVDLCSATFYASYAVCLDPSSVRARRILARCARLGGFNIVLPMSPSGSAGSASASASKLNSFDNKDHAGAQACIHILQQGTPATFQDPGCAKEYREACRLLGRNADALQVSELLTEKVQGKRKAIEDMAPTAPPPELVSQEARYRSQLATDDAFEFSRRNQVDLAESRFRDALSQDPLNWRAWAGMCDALSNTSAVPQAFKAQELDKLYLELEARITVPYIELEHYLKSGMAAATEDAQPASTEMARKISEDGMNKKLKVSSDRPSTLTGAQRKPVSRVAPPAPTTAQSTVTATRLHPTSRALSAAQINTTQGRNVQTDDVKASIKPVPEAPRTARIGTARAGAPTTAAGRQLRSTGARGPESTAAPRSNASLASSRSGATSQAGSVSSASSGSTVTSRDTVRATASGRRTPATASTASSQSSQRSVSGKSTSASTARSTTPATSTTTRTPSTTRPATGGNISRPASALSKASNTSTSTIRSNGTSVAASSQRTVSGVKAAAKDREAAAAASANRVKLEELVQLRETVVEQLKTLAQFHAIDKYIVGLLFQVGEAYRLLRLCQGDSSAQFLKQPVLAALLAKPEGMDDVAMEDPEEEVQSRLLEHTGHIDPFVQNSIVHHLLLARSYTECSQYSPAELHFTHVRSLNPFVTAHMDIFSLVLFHLAREVTLSALAQHLALVSPASASTQIVVGNAFSLQKEHQTALVCFQRAAAAAPDYAYAYTLAGHEAYDLGLLDEAIAYFRSAIRCDRRHWNGWAGLGRVFLEIGDHEHAACKSLQMAIEINSSNYLLWDLVGWTFSLINVPTRALECYDRAIELAPRASVLTYLRRAELLLQNGQHELSHSNLVLAHDLAPEEASIHILLAQSYMRLGGGEFCHLEKSASMAHKNGANAPGSAMVPLRASGTMVHPREFQAEISHHLAVAVDLDPTLLRVVKSICEGHKSLPGGGVGGHGYRRQQYDPHDMASLQDIQAPSFTRSDVEHESLSVDEASRQQYNTSGYAGSYGHPAHSSFAAQGQYAPHAGMSTPQTRAPPYGPDSSVVSFSSSTRTPAGLPAIAVDQDPSHRILPDASADFLAR